MTEDQLIWVGIFIGSFSTLLVLFILKKVILLINDKYIIPENNVIPKGTVVYIHGIPFKLKEAVGFHKFK